MRKKFIFINSSDSSVPSASQNRLLAIARGLSEKGSEIHWVMLASELDKTITEDIYYRGISFTAAGSKYVVLSYIKPLMYLYRLWLLLNLGRFIHNLKQADNVMICYAYNSRFLHLWLVNKLCKRNGLLLYHENTEYPHLSSSLRSRIDRYFYMKCFVPQCDHIFVISTALKQFYVENLRKSKKKVAITILNIIVEHDRFGETKGTVEDVKARDIVYIGTPYGTKDGVYDLIGAFSIIVDKYPDVRLIIVGDVTKQERMQRIYEEIAKLRDPERVVLTGRLSRPEVIKIINSAYCLTLARPNNIQAKYGFPTKLGEYLSTGRPVIVTGVGDIPLFLKDGVNAFIAKPDNIVSFAHKLCECFDNPERANQIGQRGRVVMYEKFSYNRVVEDILKV